MERASHGAEGLLDVEHRREAISANSDPLETIKKIVPWEDFRADIEGVTETKPEERKSNAGHKPDPEVQEMPAKIAVRLIIPCNSGTQEPQLVPARSVRPISATFAAPPSATARRMASSPTL